MIKSFDHRGLKLLAEKGDVSKVRPDHVKKVKKIMARLSAASSLRDLNYPGAYLHKLTGNFNGHHAVKINGNWRITFRFEDGDAYQVNYLDYH